MKLLARYSRINVVATIIIFLISSLAFFLTLRLVFIHQIDEDLKTEEKEIETFVREHKRLPESISVNDQLIHYAPAAVFAKRQFSTTTIITNGEEEKFRQLIFGIGAGSQIYTATVSKSMEEAENLARSIFIIAFATILLILLVSFLINRVVLKRIWRPFYQSLNAVKNFTIGGSQVLQLSPTAIDEFQVMNQTLKEITRRAQLDYLSLKTFSENASHEIQTPLAVIRSKLDLLMQDEKLTERQSGLLQAAFNSVQKLTRLNQSLLLLARIENHQFNEIKSINLKKKIEDKTEDFSELWTTRQLALNTELQDVKILMDEELLDILLNNLFSNAIKHNFGGGKVSVVLNGSQLTVANSSHAPELRSEQLYRRFSKASHGSESNGLGLSIIKQICDTCGFAVRYGFKDGWHFFVIAWEQ